MSAIVIDGKAAAAALREEARQRTERLKERGVTPCLAVILVGEDPASLSYVTAKQKALAAAGMEGRDIRLSETTTEAQLLSLIASINADKSVHGILVQLPLPAHIREEAVITAIEPGKDVDCFHPVNVGKLLLGRPGFLPCTPHGVLDLLKGQNIPTKGAHAVVVGRSNIVGKPLAVLLARRELNATVTLCHTGTKDLPFHTRQADILIAAAGTPGLIKKDMIKKGAAVIDVGVNRVADTSARGYHLAGDVDFDGAAEAAGWITPVPGGVGPMTIAMLMRNVAQAAEERGGANGD
ncbi:MAG: bifunctional 5,10-methylene-tetrahydrofolate dehydrogenase/5,10-methylene-tetrahydrofolate cyclohydrolase [Treponema sp.]|nr:bifunctional 5,10-methylene-tetrahydrofolate dehydrogenase/5,10-methylene-tetrahydrofolate cyclohydrolase [Treponema sp.]